MKLTRVTLAENPSLKQSINPLHSQFPRFITAGDKINHHYWTKLGLYETFPSFQFALCTEAGEVVACGHTIPLDWNGSIEDLPSGYDMALARGFQCFAEKRIPNTLCALAAITSPGHKGAALSYKIITAMKELASQHGHQALIAPVRPNRKEKYPLQPIDDYVRWMRHDGAPFDPWLRVHWRLGGKFLCVAKNSMTVTGSVAEWEEWTGLSFPQSGDYVVSQAFHPIQINLTAQEVEYIEPNVWIKHDVSL